jgi:hypothetical protein
MTNDQSPTEQQDDTLGYALGEINANVNWLMNSVDRVDKNISEDRDKIAQWKSSLEEKVTLVLRCAKDLKTGARDLEIWKNSIEGRLHSQEAWKAQHSQIEDWKKDKEKRLGDLEAWKSSQSGAWNLVKYMGTGVFSAFITFLLTYFFLMNRPAQ